MGAVWPRLTVFLSDPNLATDRVLSDVVQAVQKVNKNLSRMREATIIQRLTDPGHAVTQTMQPWFWVEHMRVQPLALSLLAVMGNGGAIRNLTLREDRSFRLLAARTNGQCVAALRIDELDEEILRAAVDADPACIALRWFLCQQQKGDLKFRPETEVLVAGDMSGMLTGLYELVTIGELLERHGRPIEVSPFSKADWLRAAERTPLEVCQDGWGANSPFKDELFLACVQANPAAICNVMLPTAEMCQVALAQMGRDPAEAVRDEKLVRAIISRFELDEPGVRAVVQTLREHIK